MLKKKSFLKKVLRLPESIIYDYLYEYGIAKANHVIVQSVMQKNLLKENFMRDALIIRSGHPIHPSFDRKFPLKILWIGSIKPVKRPDLFIRLVESCQGLNIEFVLAGQKVDKKFADDVFQRTTELKNFRYIGEVPFAESAHVISSAHILVNTTENGYEGLPNAFVQAWLAGVFVLSLNCDPDGFLNQENLGYQNPDLKFIEEKIRHFEKNSGELEKLSDHIRETAITHFSLEKITAKLIALAKSS